MHFFLFHLLSFKGKDSNCTTQDHVKYLTKHLGELRRPEGVGRWKGRGNTDTCLVKNSAAVKLKDPLTFFFFMLKHRWQFHFNCWWKHSLLLLQHLTDCEEIPEYLLIADDVLVTSCSDVPLFASIEVWTPTAACAYLHPWGERSKRRASSLRCCPSSIKTVIGSSPWVEVHLWTWNASILVFC